MKMQRYYMEDWLNDSRDVAFNLSASGCQDFYLHEFLNLCQVDLQTLPPIFLGDNDTRGSLRLREAICASYEHVRLEDVLVTNGSSEALFVFSNELLEPGDEVVIPFPAFQCLYQIPIAIGCQVKFLPLLECAQWKLDIEKLAELVTPNTKLIIINTPHNPIGWTLMPEELRQIAMIARQHDCYLLFDEHYRYLPLTPGNQLIPSGYDLCRPIHARTYATGSMIKCFGIVGLRIGWLIGDPAFLAKCRDYKDYLTHTTPAITDYLAYLALKNQAALIAFHKARILQNLAALNAFMRHNADLFEYVEPTGGIVCFPKLRQGRDATSFCEGVWQQCQVSLLPGFAFEVPGHFRLNFGIDPEKFERALELIQQYLPTLSGCLKNSPEGAACL